MAGLNMALLLKESLNNMRGELGKGCTYLMCPRMPHTLGSLERGGKEKRIERFKETGK